MEPHKIVDYIIVGFGLAGLSFAEQLEQHQKSFVVFENNSQQSSRVAGGLYNPVILKRFTLAWRAHEQMEVAQSFYTQLEQKLNHKYNYPLPVLRRFNAIAEQNLWFEAIDKPFLDKFLAPDLIPNENTGLAIPHHYGKVNHTGRIDIAKLLNDYIQHLEASHSIIQEGFDYKALEIHDNHITYKGIQAKHIVFSEGFGIHHNPYFNTLPINGNKGEYIIIEAKTLKLDQAVKSSIFIIPLGNDHYKVGATYDRNDTSSLPTLEAKTSIVQKLDMFLKVPYTVIDQVAGIRPTVRDRRPIVGTHPEYSNVHLINGLGSRGILIAPTVAQQLYDAIANAIPLPQEIDCNRFMSLEDIK